MGSKEGIGAFSKGSGSVSQSSTLQDLHLGHNASAFENACANSQDAKGVLSALLEFLVQGRGANAPEWTCVPPSPSMKESVAETPPVVVPQVNDSRGGKLPSHPLQVDSDTGGRSQSRGGKLGSILPHKGQTFKFDAYEGSNSRKVTENG